MRTSNRVFASMIAALLITTPVQAFANIGEAGAVMAESSAPLSQFTPRPTKATRIDYEPWDFILSETVLFMGPSTRTRASKQGSQTGTRLQRIEDSPYRMEGNKVLYPMMNDLVQEDMAAYAEELVALGNKLDIPALPRNEQLAYWLNLHNALIVTTIKANYPGPSRRPHLIKPVEGSDAKLHDAKLIEIGGQDLSLRDIRERIVYANWDNPDIAFGFHHGHLGGPSIMNIAYTGENLRSLLRDNATEYANSLRGYHSGRLAPFFYEIAPWYFPDFKKDLTTYLKRRMRSEVFSEFEQTGIRSKNSPEYVVADISSGYGLDQGIGKFYGNPISLGSSANLGPAIEAFLVERELKAQKLLKTDWFKRGTVTIEDIETDDGIPDEIE